MMMNKHLLSLLTLGMIMIPGSKEGLGLTESCDGCIHPACPSTKKKRLGKSCEAKKIKDT